VEYFQAGHASSILVTRSTALLLVNSTLSVPNLFEHQDDKTNQAGHAHFMIIACDLSKCLVRQDFRSRESRYSEVDQARSVPNSCPIVMSLVSKIDLSGRGPDDPRRSGAEIRSHPATEVQLDARSANRPTRVVRAVIIGRGLG
jgi:hypothetical protein